MELMCGFWEQISRPIKGKTMGLVFKEKRHSFRSFGCFSPLRCPRQVQCRRPRQQRPSRPPARPAFPSALPSPLQAPLPLHSAHLRFPPPMALGWSLASAAQEVMVSTVMQVPVLGKGLKLVCMVDILNSKPIFPWRKKRKSRWSLGKSTENI